MSRVSRRCVLLMPLAAAACVAPRESLPTVFEPLDFDYLTKLRLSVASVDIDDGWRPGPGSRDVGYLSPVVPVVALRRMAEQRVLPGGGPGRAVFTIEEASLVVDGGNYVGDFAARLEVLDGGGGRAGFAEARVSRSATAHTESPARMRAGLYQITRQMMADMNVELEYQVNRSLKGFLQAAASTAPVPERVDAQELPPP